MNRRRPDIFAQIAAQFSRTERLLVSLVYCEQLTLEEAGAVLKIPCAEAERMLGSIKTRVGRVGNAGSE